MKIKYLLSYLGFFVTSMFTVAHQEKVLIITHSYNRPDFIELQNKTFKAFLKDPYEFVVFNDAPDATMEKKIEEACNKCAIKCVRIPQELHTVCQEPSARHGHGIKYSLETLGFNHDGTVCIIDSDMFLVRPFSINEYLKDYDFVCLRQQRPEEGTAAVVYSALFVVLMNMNTLPNKTTINFDRGTINGQACDTGASTYYYFRDNPSVRINFYQMMYLVDLLEVYPEVQALDHVTQNFLKKARELSRIESHGMQFHTFNFLHYRAASNYDMKSKAFHEQKTALVNCYIDEMIRFYNI